MALHEGTFFREILALASAGHMASVVQSVLGRREWLLRRARPAQAGQPYGRSPEHRDPRGEVMLAGWTSGARCAPHDHDQARGVVVVLAGSFTETRYRHTGSALVPIGTAPAGALRTLAVAPGLIHDLRCDHGGATLHVYLPAIARMRVYDVIGRRTLTVGEQSGAWIPRDARHVLDSAPWHANRAHDVH